MYVRPSDECSSDKIKESSPFFGYHIIHRVRKKVPLYFRLYLSHFLVDFSIKLETGMNTPQSYVITYLIA